MQRETRETKGSEISAKSVRLGRPSGAGVERALAASLRLTFVPVVLLVLGGIGAFAYGVALFIHSAAEIISHPFPIGNKVGLFLLDIDLFLIGTTFLISAVGLYELFIREIRVDEATRMPAWLDMRDLNDLKGRIIAMIVMVLSVSFVEVAVDASDGPLVLQLGGGIALVVLALTAFVRFTGHADDKS
jgi:uncharacterized protein (TIGR00645 family)